MAGYVAPAPRAPGTLVSTRGRNWVVLPSAKQDLLLLRPLTGGMHTTAGLFWPIEHTEVKDASFPRPKPDDVGDTAGCLLLYNAARLNLRHGAAPFRCLGHLSVVPRPYQLVPLIMALRQDTVRLLIADDVGVGKTIEAALIARELLDRGHAQRLAVICPAHLCDQWGKELREKFSLDPKIIQPSQVARLQRELPRHDLSIYQHYPCLVISIDYVKQDRQRDNFLRNAPDLVIIDEAHLATRPRGQQDRSQHERYALAHDLAKDPSRHILLVTATPHSGIEENFRSLLGLLRPEFDADQQADISRPRLLPYVIQRRRSDLERWLGIDTPFPQREAQERTYALSAEYDSLFRDVLAYCRETVVSRTGLQAHQQRVRHWAAIALLRCLLSSPGAAVAVLGNRAGVTTAAEAPEEATEDMDAAYRPQVLDPMDEQSAADYVPSAPIEDAQQHLSESEKRRLLAFRRRAEYLAGPERDRKLVEAAGIVGEMLAGGYRPIVFCRFIPTANYLAEQLPQLLGSHFPRLRVVAVTGEIGDEERREKVEELAREPARVLVATDCLSEGINLQDHFDAVLHYDLPWNPNRLEQREGRVDRFGQPRPVVRTVLLYGSNNQIDLQVLEVLIRKAGAIRRRLGIAVPVPVESEQVMQAIIANVLLRRPDAGIQLQLDLQAPDVSRLHAEWDKAAEREGESRAFFAQHGIQPDEVARELAGIDPVLGTPEDVRTFILEAARRFSGELRPTRPEGSFELDPGSLRPLLAGRGFTSSPLRVTFDALKGPDALCLGRTHPVVAAFCDAVLGRAMAEEPDGNFARGGAMYTGAVGLRTALVLLRLRYLLKAEKGGERFAEEVALAAFQRREGRLAWLQPLDSVGPDLLRRALANGKGMPVPERRRQVEWALSMLPEDGDWHTALTQWRQAQLQASHGRLRALTRSALLEVHFCPPPDILGCYVLVPSGGDR